MQHLDEGTMHSWLDGALGAEEAVRVEAHVAECRQCAAAVAEARGFIAASSRILTALDHLPHGVVPAAPPVKWHNRAVWRAVAAVLVVAVGSLVVVRSSEYMARVASGTPDSARVSEAVVSAPSRVAKVIVLDVGSEQLPLKVVGTPRTIGAKVTLYEVAPGDTVTLTEPMSVQLNSAVTTGISTTGAVGAPSPAPIAPVPAAQVMVANGVTMIHWADSITGNLLKLSGRMPAAQLQQIKLRIERERAAAAGAKKRP